MNYDTWIFIILSFPKDLFINFSFNKFIFFYTIQACFFTMYLSSFIFWWITRLYFFIRKSVELEAYDGGIITDVTTELVKDEAQSKWDLIIDVFLSGSLGSKIEGNLIATIELDNNVSLTTYKFVEEDITETNEIQKSLTLEIHSVRKRSMFLFVSHKTLMIIFIKGTSQNMVAKWLWSSNII